MRLAIVADDLTGALDVSAPFAAHGLRVVVAVTPAATAEAIASGAEVVCVNTASRELSADAARDAVAAAARLLAAAKPEIALKKIDSRLKGHVAAETLAMMAAFGKSRALVAPAVPGQNRIVRDGHVVGHGVMAPLNIATALGDVAHHAPDTAHADAFHAIATDVAPDTLLVGAAGLGHALAQRLGHTALPASLQLPGPLLVAIGSHDPITLRQVEVAVAEGGFKHIISRDGQFDIAGGRPTLVQAVVPRGENFAAAMARFGASVASLLRRGGFGTVLLSGGETAQSVLGQLGVDCLEVIGEILPGIPLTRASIGDLSLTILTKSGGFGTPQDILRLAEAARGAAPVTEHALAGEH